MKIYVDSTKTELVAEIPEQSIIALLEWEHAEYSDETRVISIPIRPDGSNEIFDVLVAASYSFGTDFKDICNDFIELCVNTDRAECFLYVNDGVENDTWGYVELSNEEFFMVSNRVYEVLLRRK